MLASELMSQPNLPLIIVGLGIALLAFLIIRELSCWYWKINQTVRLLATVAARLNQANTLLQSLADGAAEANRHIRSLPAPPAPARAALPAAADSPPASSVRKGHQGAAAPSALATTPKGGN